MTKYRVIRITVGLLVLSSCEPLIEIDQPKTELTSETVFKDAATANAALLGIYFQIAEASLYVSSYNNGLRIIAAQSSDEYNSLSSSSHIEIFENEITSDNTYTTKIWHDAYNIIYGTNAMLEGLQRASISENLKHQLEGEARFLRAFNYFYLVNFFGDVPLIITTNYKINRLASRANVMGVYQLIKDDLIKAQELLAPDYSYSTGERVRVNRAAASALLARIWLYVGDWPAAEAESTKVINNASYKIVTNINHVFLANSMEAIWQLKPTASTRNNAPEAYTSLSPTFGTLTSHLLNAFELNDKRKSAWTTVNGIYAYSRKYKATSTTPPNTEYSIVLRLAEQYLIRAEARTQQGNVIGAKEDIDVIRTRAGLPETTANTQAELLNAIEQERRIELFTEYGHRWLDLKRWGKAGQALKPIKPFWDDATDMLYPLPQKDLLKAPNLTQNPGY